MCDAGSSAHGLLIPGPTPEPPKIGRLSGYHGDRHSWSHVVSDIERAIDQALIGQALEWRIVVATTKGWSINRFAEQAQMGDERVLKAFNSGCERMARWLGWEPDATE